MLHIIMAFSNKVHSRYSPLTSRTPATWDLKPVPYNLPSPVFSLIFHISFANVYTIYVHTS